MVKTQEGPSHSDQSTNRIFLLDEIRGACILCMLFYHTFIILGDYYGLSLGTRAYSFFLPVQPFFSAMFIFVCGISSRLSHSNLKRGLKLLVLAIAFSLITIYLLPLIHIEGAEDRFGILHLLSLCILCFALTHRWLDKIPPQIGMVLCFALYILLRGWELGYVGLSDSLSWHWPEQWKDIYWLFPLGIHSEQFYSADYFPLIPNFLIYFCGTYLGRYAAEGRFPDFSYRKYAPPLDWLGTHALLIYLLHVPVIYLVAFLFERVIL